MRVELAALGSTPPGENRAHLGMPSYDDRSLIECRVWRRMLLRWYPVPSQVRVAMTVEYPDHDGECYREVCVRFQGRDGSAYAFQVERRRPRLWDPIAHSELSWYCSKRMFELLVARGLTRARDVPAAYRASEPPLLPAASATSGCGPEEQAGEKLGGAVRDDPALPLILGSLGAASVPAIAVRLPPTVTSAMEVAVYASDQRTRLGTISATVQDGRTRLAGDEFYVHRRFDDNELLVSALFSDLFEVTGRLGPRQANGERPAIWRIKDAVLRTAEPMSANDLSVRES